MKNVLYCSLALALAACSSNPEQAATTTAAPTETPVAAKRELPKLLQQALEAHGGLAAWQQFGTMSYQLSGTLGGETREEKQLIDLRTRQVRVKGPTYQLGLNDQNQLWVSPNKAAFGKMSARFYHNLYFYFFAIPFVLADEGTKYEDLGTQTVAGKSYRALKVTYEDGRGDSSGDAYIAHFNPETYRLELVLYTVTFFEPGKEATYNALLYPEWQQVNGLLLPTRMEGHKFADNQIGELRYQGTFSQVELTAAQPQASLFAMPKEAEVDSLK